MKSASISEPATSSSQPLLHDDRQALSNSSPATPEHHSANPQKPPSRFALVYATHARCRESVKIFLSSRAQHWTVLGLVTCDLLGIFTDIIINLYQCDERETAAFWSDVRGVLGIAGLVFSCLFMLELLMSVWAFGWSYFNSYFHTFDATVIFAGFVVDVLLHGIVEEVASLVVILRLWRFFKIIEEFTVGAQEQMDGLELRIEQLESENFDLKRELKKQKGTLDEEEEAGLLERRGSWK